MTPSQRTQWLMGSGSPLAYAAALLAAAPPPDWMAAYRTVRAMGEEQSEEKSVAS